MVGVGVNNYLFIIFCIAFAFTVGSIYHNVLMVEGKATVDNVVEEEVDGEKVENIISDEDIA